MEELYNKQLNLILELFSFARENDLFLLLSGGWNIDLRFEEKVREHNDIDLHFDLAELNAWLEVFQENKFEEEKVDDWYWVFRNDSGINIDFEAVKIDKEVITWKYGNTSPLSEVVEEFDLDGNRLVGMKLNVELYKKEQKQQGGAKLRPKDLIDIKFLEKMITKNVTD